MPPIEPPHFSERGLSRSEKRNKQRVANGNQPIETLPLWAEMMLADFGDNARIDRDRPPSGRRKRRAKPRGG
jgi:hypothetical protein